MKKLKFGTPVSVEWHDSIAREGWHYDPSVRRLVAKLRSIGYVVQDDKEGLTITTSLGSRQESMDDLTIPKGAIQGIEVLPEEFNYNGPER